MTISETGSVQGWAERVDAVARYRGGSSAWAARGTTHTRANCAWSMQLYKGPVEEDALRKNEEKVMSPKRSGSLGRAAFVFRDR